MKKRAQKKAPKSVVQHPRSKLRRAFVDIETSPNLAYVWGKWEQNVIAFKEEWRIIAFAVKYEGDKRVYTYALPDFSLYKKDPLNDRDLVKMLRDVLDDADEVVAHNGDRFDIPKANARIIAHGFTPPSPYRAVDTKKIAKRHFKFDSNKLDDLGEYLGVGRKMATGGFSLWLGCLAGDMGAWTKMKKYNGQDVVLLENIYQKFAPWNVNFTNRNAFHGTRDACPRCSSKKMQARGYLTNTSGKFQRFQCQDCGGWCKGKHQTGNVILR